MKYVITERQYKVITEQVKANLTPTAPSSVLQPTTKVKSGTINPTDGKGAAVDVHTLMALLAIGTAFIPVAGPFISAGIGFADAALYYKEGDKTSAGITAAFSMIPFIGKIPGVKELGAKGMAALGSKVAKGVKVFTPAEVKALNGIKQNEALVKKGLESASSKISGVANEIKSLKPAYVKRFGQDKYENLLREFLSGRSDKLYFIQSLQDGQKSLPKLAKMTVQSGIKFAKYELEDISELASIVKKGEEGVWKLELYVQGVRKDVDVIVKNLPNETFNGQAVGRSKIYMNLKNLAGKSEQEIRQILTHEATHIKDPSLVSPKFNQSYDAIQAAKNAEYKKLEALTKYTEMTGKGLDDAIGSSKKYVDLYKRYLYHPQEIVANNQMVLNNMTTELKNVIQTVGPKGAAKELDNIISFSSGKTPLSQQSAELLGDIGSQHLIGLSKYNQKYYQNFLKKLAKQSEYLKSQLKLLENSVN
jgi:hypothetical protein